jgi:hypothetical protein
MDCQELGMLLEIPEAKQLFPDFIGKFFFPLRE